VIDLLKRRAARASRPPHGDGASIALVVEGGAMRGVISAGMVSALEHLGLTGAFDAVYGSSAGAINAAYFLAGQAAFGTTIYYEDINTPAFINTWRPFTGRPIVDLTFLTTRVMTEQKALDFARVIASPAPLFVLATDVATGRGVTFSGFTGGDDLRSALRAGATMPVLAGPPWPHRQGRYLDAGLTEPIPVAAAEAAGHTHVLVLLTRPGPMPWQVSRLDRYYVAPRLGRWSADLANRYLTRRDPYAEVLAAIEAGTGPMQRAVVRGLRVPGLVVDQLERDADRLRDAARRGRDVVLTAFA
jgi:predicted patatin/cPLA2 family phospholipase